MTASNKNLGATIEANGTQLYCEIRGTGPSVLFISGPTGDAGHFERVAEELADEFTVITYDRRGNSRSPRPAGWTTTSAEEQADDAILAAIRIPVQVMHGDASPELFADTSRWLATRLGVEPQILPGGHAPYLDRPKQMVEAIRPFLRQTAA